jgi:hypothetical protein
MDPTEREQIMKRIAIVLGIFAAMLVAPAVASAGNVPSQVKAAQVRAQIVTTQQVRAQIFTTQVVVAQIARTQRIGANRITLIRPHSR